MNKSINKLKNLLKWSDRLGSDENYEIKEIIKELEEYNSTEKVNRVEVINHQDNPIGRVFTKYNCENVELQLQDDNKTLKIFISKK